MLFLTMIEMVNKWNVTKCIQIYPLNSVRRKD